MYCKDSVHSDCTRCVYKMIVILQVTFQGYNYRVISELIALLQSVYWRLTIFAGSSCSFSTAVKHSKDISSYISFQRLTTSFLNPQDFRLSPRFPVGVKFFPPEFYHYFYMTIPGQLLISRAFKSTPQLVYFTFLPITSLQPQASSHEP